MEYQKPEVSVLDRCGNKGERYDHPAYGVVTLSCVHGKQTLFGSDIGHSSAMRIEVRSAHLDRTLSRDWIHGDKVLIDFELSHAQWAEFITSQGNGNGTPCTLRFAPKYNTIPGDVQMEIKPGIINVESKAELHRKEIAKMAKEQMEKVATRVAKLEAMIDGGNISKKALRELVSELKCHVGNTPANMQYVVKSAEEALENAVAHSKAEVEAFIGQRLQRIGLDNINQLLIGDKSHEEDSTS